MAATLKHLAPTEREQSPVDQRTPGLRAGEVVADKYRIEQFIGRGGMGVVVRATQLNLDRPVALKLLSTELSSMVQFTKRFAREARAMAKLDNEHVVRVFDVCALDDGTPFIVMEYLSGQSLKQLLGKAGPLPPERAVDLLLEACEVIAEAHGQGIVHRDLKPSNLFLAERSDGSTVLKVLDFGIAKALRDASGKKPESTLTTASDSFGSPQYMAPEHVRSVANTDVRSDLWSLGVVLYELVSGQMPFDGNSPGAIYAKILEAPPTPLSSFGITVPDDVTAVIARCLEKKPERRFADVIALARKIAPAGSEKAQRSLNRIERWAQSARNQTGGRQTKPLPETDALCSAPVTSTNDEASTDVTRHVSPENLEPLGDGETAISAERDAGVSRSSPRSTATTKKKFTSSTLMSPTEAAHSEPPERLSQNMAESIPFKRSSSAVKIAGAAAVVIGIGVGLWAFGAARQNGTDATTEPSAAPNAIKAEPAARQTVSPTAASETQVSAPNTAATTAEVRDEPPAKEKQPLTPAAARGTVSPSVRTTATSVTTTTAAASAAATASASPDPSPSVSTAPTATKSDPYDNRL